MTRNPFLNEALLTQTTLNWKKKKKNHITSHIEIKTKMIPKVSKTNWTLKFLRRKFELETLLYFWNFNLFNIVVINSVEFTHPTNTGDIYIILIL